MSQPRSPRIRPPLRWQTLQNLPRHQCPAPRLRSWLADAGSLTARLLHLSHGQFEVEVLHQAIGKPDLSEQQVMGMARQELALIRTVILRGQGQAWVFARSVLPLRSLTGRLRHLRKQGNRPLGAFLFSQPDLQRSPIAVARISVHDGYLPAALGADQILWGRRSVFSLNAKPLLVSEVFLPAFCAHLL